MNLILLLAGLLFAAPTAEQLGDQAAASDDPQAIVRLATQAIKIWKPENGKEQLSWLYATRSDGHLRLGQNKLALRDVDSAIRLDPEPEAHNMRGQILERLKRWDQAYEAYTRSIKLAESIEPQGCSKWAAYYNRGSFLISRKKRLEAGLADYTAAAQAARRGGDPRGEAFVLAAHAWRLCKRDRHKEGLAIIASGSPDAKAGHTFAAAACHYWSASPETEAALTRFIQAKLGPEEDVERMKGTAKNIPVYRDPDGIEVHSNWNHDISAAFYWRGLLREKGKRFTDALADYYQAVDAAAETKKADLRKEFDLADSHYRIGRLLELGGQKDLSKKAYAEACSLGRKQSCVGK